MIIHADILEWAKSYDGPLFHALLCDAPYHLTGDTGAAHTPDLIAENEARSGKKTSGYFTQARNSGRGFMGKSWDGVDENGVGIAFNPEMWKAVARCLHPGAFLFVFAGTINDDLISVAMRQAGLRKYHKSMAWGYGSGFPKATDLPAQIDEDAFQRWLATHAAERAVLVDYRDAVRIARNAHKSDPMAVPRSAITTAHNDYRAKRLAIKAAAGFLKTKGTKRHQPKFAAAELGYREKDNGYNSKERESFTVSAPATPMAQTWDGYAYGGQMIKPAVESILIFQKPYAGSPVESITRTGAGALNIDGGRINPGETVSGGGPSYGKCAGVHEGWKRPGHQDYENKPSHDAGRWPANLILAHDPRCEPVGVRRVRGHTSGDSSTSLGGYRVYQRGEARTREQKPIYADADGRETVAAWRCVEGCAVLALGRQSGESESKANMRGLQLSGASGGVAEGTARIKADSNSLRGHEDTGTAARFFFNADYLLERLEETDAVLYQAKASRAEREAGLDPRQVKLLGMLETIEDSGRDHSAYGEFNGIPGTKHTPNQRRQFDESTINDGRAKSIDNPYQRGETTRRNTHPTIKPISLARHLATLLLPPDMYAPRRLLIPFSGAGSEMIGAMLAGWEDVIGVELEADHVKIAEARLAYWSQRRHEFGDPSKPITAVLSEATDGQLDLFEDTP